MVVVGAWNAWVRVLVPQIALQAVWAGRLDFQPDLEALDVEDVVAFSREPFDSLVSCEVFQADIASFKTHVFVSLQEYYRFDLSEVLVVVRVDLLEGLGESLPVLGQDNLLVHDVIGDTPLHQENPVLMEGSHELLPPINLLLHVADRAVKQI